VGKVTVEERKQAELLLNIGAIDAEDVINSKKDLRMTQLAIFTYMGSQRSL
jgi:hypothetical protein